jgi:outer membrane protein OmpA-like peptidoglycan-associated protein
LTSFPKTLKAQEKWEPLYPFYLDNVFFYISGQYFMLPDLADIISPEMASRYGVSEGIIPYPVFRIGVGYEWEKLQFSIESGYTYIKGDNPLVLNVFMIPFLLKAGYSFYPFKSYKRFNIKPTAALGFVYSGADYYKDALNLLIGRLTYSTGTGLLVQPGFRIGWNPSARLGRMLEIFTGASIDLIIETDGLIPLPQIELGVLVRPFPRKPRPPVPETFVEIYEPKFFRRIYLVTFHADSAFITRDGFAVLDEAAAILDDFDELKIIVRGFAAPFVSAQGQREVSRRRAVNCASYLMEKHEIPEELITIEWVGAEESPENTLDSNHSQRRSVEIIIEGRKIR